MGGGITEGARLPGEKGTRIESKFLRPRERQQPKNEIDYELFMKLPPRPELLALVELFGPIHGGRCGAGKGRPTRARDSGPRRMGER